MSDPHGQALLDMRDRCVDMLADVPGKDLEEKVTKIVGDYLALQIMLQEARAQVEDEEKRLAEYKQLLDISARSTERCHDALTRILALDGSFDLIDAQKIAYAAVTPSPSSTERGAG